MGGPGRHGLIETLTGLFEAARQRLRIRRRGALLLVLALADIGYGVAIITAAEHFYAGQPKWWPASVGGLYGIPIEVWGGVWVGVGLFLLTGVPRRFPDYWQFTVAVGLSAWWAFTAFVYALVTGYPGVWGPGCLYAGLSLIVLIAAGWEDEA